MDLQSEIMLAILSEMTPTTTYSDRGARAAEKCTAITIEKMGEFAEWCTNKDWIYPNKYDRERLNLKRGIWFNDLKFDKDGGHITKATYELVQIFLNQK